MSPMSPMSPMSAPMPFSQDRLPEAIRVPAGHRVAMETVGTGEITYECRDRAAGSGQEWAFVGPEAVLADRTGRRVGRYYGPPATWESDDGSKLTATQVAVAPAGAGDIPLQLVRANPATGAGAMTGVSYVQRVATRGGVAPASPCDAGQRGRRATVKYQADYVFYRAG
ncbi:MAG: DUF3455 domain-containing protein [Burkholderiales bacterium]|nr:MAG: DUF3455 domain-containing protein [Burkholderiales bacterium]